MSRISKVHIKNWIGIDEVDIDLGKINTLKGKTGSGKTSFIEALEKAFTNKNRRTEVVKHGENEATIFVQTDDGLEINRKVRNGEKADYLKISKPGQAVPSNESFLKKFVSGDIFRPLEFIRKSNDEQAKIILNMLDIPWRKEDIVKWFGELPAIKDYGVHILQILKQIETFYYESREVINREIKTLEAQAKGIRDELPPNYDGEKWRQEKITSYYSKVAEAEENNKKLLAAQIVINGLGDKISAINGDCSFQISKCIANHTNSREDIKNQIDSAKQRLQKPRELISTLGVRTDQAMAKLENEFELELEKLKARYQEKKNEVVKLLTNEVVEAKDFISRGENYIVGKEQELATIDTLETQEIESIKKLSEEQIKTAEATAGNAKKVLEELREIDVHPLREDAEHVAHMQGFLRDYDRMKDIVNERIEPRVQKSKDMTEKIEKGRELPRELLKIASMPIDGIEVDETGRIRINGTLISDLSEGEQLQLGFRVAKAQCGELKTICLDGINKINESYRRILEEEMLSDDYQYIILETADGDFSIEIGGEA